MENEQFIRWQEAEAWSATVILWRWTCLRCNALHRRSGWSAQEVANEMREHLRTCNETPLS